MRGLIIIVLLVIMFGSYASFVRSSVEKDEQIAFLQDKLEYRNAELTAIKLTIKELNRQLNWEDV